MLALLLLLAAPQATTPQTLVLPPAPPPPPSAMRNFGKTPFSCRTGPITTIQPVVPNGGLMWRQSDQPVGHYLLLDRYVDGCPAPIVVNYRVPGSNAVGREIGRPPVEDRLPRD